LAILVEDFAFALGGLTGAVYPCIVHRELDLLDQRLNEVDVAMLASA
jgi:hypothetical protein